MKKTNETCPIKNVVWGTCLGNVVGIMIGLFGLVLIFHDRHHISDSVQNGILSVIFIVGLLILITHWIQNIRRMFQGRLILHSVFKLKLPGNQKINLRMPLGLKNGWILIYFCGISSRYYGNIIVKRNDLSESSVPLYKGRRYYREDNVTPFIIPIASPIDEQEDLELIFQLEATFPKKPKFYTGEEAVAIQIRSSRS